MRVISCSSTREYTRVDDEPKFHLATVDKDGFEAKKEIAEILKTKVSDLNDFLEVAARDYGLLVQLDAEVKCLTVKSRARGDEADDHRHCMVLHLKVAVEL